MANNGWVDIPPIEGSLVVNFGKLLSRWTENRLPAAEHRVLSLGHERFSLPFFYEPHVNAQIKPLPLANTHAFAPFVYGDYVWDSIPRLRKNFGERPAA